jgi:hypothetical protein
MILLYDRGALGRLSFFDHGGVVAIAISVMSFAHRYASADGTHTNTYVLCQGWSGKGGYSCKHQSVFHRSLLSLLNEEKFEASPKVPAIGFENPSAQAIMDCSELSSKNRVGPYLSTQYSRRL